MTNKFVSLEKAISHIQDSTTICTSGFVGIGTPDYLLHGLSERFLQTQTPKDLNLVFAAGQGDGKYQGLNRIAHKGLLKRVIGGHWALAPKLGKLALENECEAYNLPQGVISHLIRDIAAGNPGTFSKVGLHTFVDPRFEGGKINERSSEDLLNLVELNGEEWLFYKGFSIDVALIRGTYADEHGNISFCKEALSLDNLSMAMAARNSGGLVIAQVEAKAEDHTLPAKMVKVPGMLVDYVVVSPKEYHQQTYATSYNPAFSSELRIKADDMPHMALSARKIIARRAAQELPKKGVINLGIGMPEGVANIANEAGVLEDLTLTTEAGSVGGVPQSGLDFGATVNADAILDQNQQFDFYDGGGLDMACLGMAEIDGQGNVNVSRFGNRLAGCGGFINISQNAKKVVYVGTFTAGGLELEFDDGGVKVLTEGRSRKFISEVSQITFNGEFSQKRDQSVLYVTERCVFKLTKDGLELIEIAAGIDLEKDILAHMDFTPVIQDPVLMDSSLFK